MPLTNQGFQRQTYDDIDTSKHTKNALSVFKLNFKPIKSTHLI